MICLFSWCCLWLPLPLINICFNYSYNLVHIFCGFLLCYYDCLSWLLAWMKHWSAMSGSAKSSAGKRSISRSSSRNSRSPEKPIRQTLSPGSPQGSPQGSRSLESRSRSRNSGGGGSNSLRVGPFGASIVVVGMCVAWLLAVFLAVYKPVVFMSWLSV